MKEDYILIDKMIDEINDIAINFTIKEHINEELAFEAYSYVNLMQLDDIGDFILFLSALNLLNSYVKQDNHKINYKFKNELSIYLDRILIYKSKDITVNNENNLLIIQIRKLQFSFHYVKINTLGNVEFDTRLEWDGIRKQPCSKTIFEICKNNKIGRSFKTFRGKNLNSKVENYVNNFKTGKMDFDNIKKF